MKRLPVWLVLAGLCVPQNSFAQSVAMTWGAIKGGRVIFSAQETGKESVATFIAQKPSPDALGNIPLLQQRFLVQYTVEEGLLALPIFGVSPIFRDTSLGPRVVGFSGKILYQEGDDGIPRYLIVYWKSPLEINNEWLMLAGLKDPLKPGSRIIWFAVLQDRIQERIIWQEPVVNYWQQLARVNRGG